MDTRRSGDHLRSVGEVKRRVAILELARQREPALLVAGQTVSGFGDGVALVALTLLVLDTTHDSVTKLAWFATARMIPLVVFILFGGAIVDRFSRRLLLLISDAGRAMLTAGLVALVASGALRYWELLVFSVLFGVFDALFMPAIAAITPEIVSEELLPAMNAVRPLANNLVGNMIGPAVGGILAAISTSLSLSVDGATFLVSATALTLMHPTPKPTRTEGTSMLSEIRIGLHYVRTTRWIWTTLLAVSFLNAAVFVPTSVLLPYFFRHTLHVSKTELGFAFAVQAFAGVIGALIAGNRKTPRRRVRVTWIYWSIGSLAALVMGFATNYWEVLIFPVIAWPMMILGNVIWETMMQSEVPRELLGRVSSVDWFLSLGLSPLGLMVSGILAGVFSVRSYFVVVGAVGALLGVGIISSRKINEIDRDRVKGTEVAAPEPAAVPPVENLS